MKTESDSQRFRLTVAYDGRPFEGWQSQPGGNTVQDHLLGVLQKICPEIATVQGSGRTDSGVSAAGQVAHFDAPATWRMDETAWLKALNAQLPATIRIMHCAAAAPDFHARYSAIGKIYRYRIFSGPVLPPLELGLAWYQQKLQTAPFLEAMKIFEGTHHFRAFSANRGDGKDESRDTERTIFGITHRFADENLLEIDLYGSGFLYKMVRFLIGTGYYLSAGKLSAKEVKNWLSDPHPGEKAPYCAPPDGLSLMAVRYPDES